MSVRHRIAEAADRAPGVDNDRGYFHGAKDVAWLFDDTLIVSGDDQDQEFWIASATTGQ